MPNKKIITGQNISPELFARLTELRQEMTPAETRLWQHLRAGRLEKFHFRRQQIIDRFIVDFYCHQADLVVEVDGEIHQSQKELDEARDDFLRGMGLTVLRFHNQVVMQKMDKVLSIILAACREKKNLPPAPP
jgi:very-short-patch-repair endonuclease